ncbi:hypothetical protein ACIBEA_42580 [Streptomyces sp. NPDC051555]|uniref:hypothetical protein n=1 Tax=Streptomyces sp. NPDC051555 TaxID=3365657 RepID=UPI0037A77F71
MRVPRIAAAAALAAVTVLTGAGVAVAASPSTAAGSDPGQAKVNDRQSAFEEPEPRSDHEDAVDMVAIYAR